MYTYTYTKTYMITRYTSQICHLERVDENRELGIGNQGAERLKIRASTWLQLYLYFTRIFHDVSPRRVQ
jgi:hypothetical protein